MTKQEMNIACVEADIKLYEVVKKYEMTDNELDVFYQSVARRLISTTSGWARDKWIKEAI